MNKNLTNYCTSCGEKVEDFSEKCSKCGKYPWGSNNDYLTEEESGMSIQEQYDSNYQYCINCGTSSKDLSGKYTEIVCPKCDVNPFGMGKEFRDEITINFCENCGKEVKDRDEVCSCGRLPYQYDNNETYNPEKKNIEDFTDDDWEKDKELSKVKYCIYCGFNHNSELKYNEIDMESGEVYIKCPKCGSR